MCLGSADGLMEFETLSATTSTQREVISFIKSYMMKAYGATLWMIGNEVMCNAD